MVKLGDVQIHTEVETIRSFLADKAAWLCRHNNDGSKHQQRIRDSPRACRQHHAEHGSKQQHWLRRSARACRQHYTKRRIRDLLRNRTRPSYCSNYPGRIEFRGSHTFPGARFP